jgi:hypothetical protein
LAPGAEDVTVLPAANPARPEPRPRAARNRVAAAATPVVADRSARATADGARTAPATAAPEASGRLRRRPPGTTRARTTAMTAARSTRASRAGQAAAGRRTTTAARGASTVEATARTVTVAPTVARPRRNQPRCRMEAPAEVMAAAARARDRAASSNLALDQAIQALTAAKPRCRLPLPEPGGRNRLVNSSGPGPRGAQPP